MEKKAYDLYNRLEFVPQDKAPPEGTEQYEEYLWNAELPEWQEEVFDIYNSEYRHKHQKQ